MPNNTKSINEGALWLWSLTLSSKSRYGLDTITEGQQCKCKVGKCGTYIPETTSNHR